MGLGAKLRSTKDRIGGEFGEFFSGREGKSQISATKQRESTIDLERVDEGRQLAGTSEELLVGQVSYCQLVVEGIRVLD